MINEAIVALNLAAKGLLFQSEKDELFNPVHWHIQGDLNFDQVRRLGGHPANDSVEEVELADFFDPLCREESWYGRLEKTTVRSYRALLSAIKAHLTGPRVFRVGVKNVTIYIVGKIGTEDWIGVKTTALET